MAKTNLNRRTFLRVSALASGGFMLGLYPKAAALAQCGRPAAPALLPADFISIASSGIVSITSRNPETGQHSLNMLAMLIANAVFTATGERIRTLPITKQGFSFA